MTAPRRVRAPRLTHAELEAISEAISFRLAGPIDPDPGGDNADDDDDEGRRDALEQAHKKIGFMLHARSK